jgi:hypothetical protein
MRLFGWCNESSVESLPILVFEINLSDLMVRKRGLPPHAFSWSIQKNKKIGVSETN